jgi:YbgC/YbaW family acyl-CoA thioester hydrolase
MNAPNAPALETMEEVMFFDTDAGGVVHNIAYLRFIETCRTRLAVKLGMDITALMALQQFPVVVRTEIDYRRSAKFGDVLLIRGRLEKLERARFWFRFEIVRQGDGSLIIDCLQALAMVEMPKAKPLRLPAEWRSKWPHLFASGGEG